MHGRSPHDFAWLRPATNRNHTRQEAHKHQAPSRLEPRTFLPGTRALTRRSPALYRLSYGTGKHCLITLNDHTIFNFNQRPLCLLEFHTLLRVFEDLSRSTSGLDRDTKVVTFAAYQRLLCLCTTMTISILSFKIIGRFGSGCLSQC